MPTRRPNLERDTSSVQTKTKTVRRKRFGSKFLTTVAIVGVALVLFVVTVGIGVYLLGIDRPFHAVETLPNRKKANSPGCSANLRRRSFRPCLRKKAAAARKRATNPLSRRLRRRRYPIPLTLPHWGIRDFRTSQTFSRSTPTSKAGFPFPERTYTTRSCSARTVFIIISTKIFISRPAKTASSTRTLM